MTEIKKMPLKLIVCLLLAIILDTAVQFAWKSAAVVAPDFSYSASFIRTIISNPIIIAVVALMAIQLFNWVLLLAQADLSYVQPVTSLSYVSVCVLSVIELNEKIDLIQCLGIALVIAGVWFISQTTHLTQEEGEAS